MFHGWAVVALRLDSELTENASDVGRDGQESERQTKPRAFITGLETKTGVQRETETKTFCLNYPRVDHLSRLSRVPGEITGQHNDSNLLFCIVTCYCDRNIISLKKNLKKDK